MPELVLAPSNGNSPVGLQLGVGLDVIGDDGFLQPAQMKWFQKRQHPLGIIESPAHVGVGHHVNLVANGLPHGANKIDIALHAECPVNRTPSEANLNTRASPVLGCSASHTSLDEDSSRQRVSCH